MFLLVTVTLHPQLDVCILLMRDSSDEHTRARGRGDVRHEAEAWIHTQSTSFTHMGHVYESLLSCGVAFGLVVSLLLEKNNRGILSNAENEGF